MIASTPKTAITEIQRAEEKFPHLSGETFVNGCFWFPLFLGHYATYHLLREPETTFDFGWISAVQFLLKSHSFLVKDQIHWTQRRATYGRHDAAEIGSLWMFTMLTATSEAD